MWAVAPAKKSSGYGANGDMAKPGKSGSGAARGNGPPKGPGPAAGAMTAATAAAEGGAFLKIAPEEAELARTLDDTLRSAGRACC